MAGHSKWKQIKHYKAATDAKRGAHFTKLIREITVSAKAGGGDPAGNPRLRTAIDIAKAASMPKENIERAVKKGTGELEGVDYVEVMYEGYGPGGVALLIHAVTDNPTRTVAEVRFKLSRGNGNLGASNSVAWMFERKGQLYVDATKFAKPAAETLNASFTSGRLPTRNCRKANTGSTTSAPYNGGSNNTTGIVQTASMSFVVRPGFGPRQTNRNEPSMESTAQATRTAKVRTSDSCGRVVAAPTASDPR